MNTDRNETKGKLLYGIVEIQFKEHSLQMRINESPYAYVNVISVAPFHLEFSLSLFLYSRYHL